MKLTIVIPALNEEGAIAAIIERCKSAIPEIKKQSNVTDVNIVVVSDGSTDNTINIAKSYSGIDLIIFEKNRGYGAAIKAGWERGAGDLLAFIDADGTCDPLYFGPMCKMMEERKLDVVLGSRMGANSEMPKIRRLGNTIFATLLRILSRKQLTDSASGMRVIRKSSLKHLFPLPDGLHFTPAMSARALMDSDLKIDEIPMNYKERIGRSKLSVVKDGVRFLKVILSTALYIRPSSMTFPFIGLIALACVAILIQPLHYYIENRSLEEWMIYRFLLLLLLGSLATVTFCYTLISERMIALAFLKYDRINQKSFARRVLDNWSVLTSLAGTALLIGIALVWPAIVSYVETGHVSLHWSRVVVASFCAFQFMTFLGTSLVMQLLNSLNVRQFFLKEPLSSPHFFEHTKVPVNSAP